MGGKGSSSRASTLVTGIRLSGACMQATAVLDVLALVTVAVSIK